jgi:predicted DNA-binding transcriptional regulator YafY
MKLYNLYQEVILEEINRNKSLLNEGVSVGEVEAAINGKYNVNILYRDYDGQPPSKRYIQVYNLAKTKAGNDAIRAYQIFGGSKTTPNSGNWKIFRLDRIEGWAPTKMKWQNPVSDYSSNVATYNQNGDRTMSSVTKMVDPNTFTRQRSSIETKTNNDLKTKNDGNTNTSQPIGTK